MQKGVVIFLASMLLFSVGSAFAEDSQIIDVNESEGETFIVTVDSTNLRFSPDSITLNEGDTVRFFWDGQLLAHNAVENNGLFDSGDPETSVDYSYTFAIGQNGTYEYVCEPHEAFGMVGTIIVNPLPVNDTGSSEPSPSDMNDDNEDVSIGDGSIPFLWFAPWFIGVFCVVGFVTIRKDRFQLGIIFDKDEQELIEGSSESDGETLVDSYRARVLTLCALYVAQGLPSGFITVTLVTYLVTIGVGVTEIALLLTLSTLPWTFKFLWGPIIDRFQYPSMGRRRPWILIAQSGMIIILTSMLFVPDMATNVSLIGIMVLAYNIFVSLQDVSTDALAVDVLKPHEYEKVNSYMFTSKAIGVIIGGAGLGTIIGFIGIRGAIALQIPILIAIMLVPLFMTERPGERMFPWSEGNKSDIEKAKEDQKSFKQILSNIKTAFSIRAAQYAVLLSICGSFASFLIPILPSLFLLELDWSAEEFNATKGGIIMIMHIVGYILGGQLGKWFGGKLVVIYSTLGAIICLIVWGIAAPLWNSTFFMILIWSICTIMWGIVAISMYSLLMRITWSEVGGTQFTGYMAMLNLSAVIGYQLSGPIANRYDFTTIFFITAILESLIILVVLFIDPEETRRELAKRIPE